MQLKDLYSKKIDRTVNPAVSATKFDAETEDVEIKEYVFTDEIINGLYRILYAIKNNKPYDHVGIWIDGYYGSGKSHFLKYLDYCIMPRTHDDAVARLLEAVRAIDPYDTAHNIECTYEDVKDITDWLKRATIDTCIFNLETSYDNSTDKKKAFLHIFWSEFNAKRGFNKFNITLAQNLEKPLKEKGVFEKFKERIAKLGGDWNNSGEAADLVDNELGQVLDIACELAPTLDKESIRERIIKRDTHISIERFASEMASYLKDKGDNYRLIFLADEVSQFINKERDRYLNLQEIITKLSEACDNKVWVVCTAQQDLSEIMDDCQIVEERDKEGKIKGRFEVKVSLKGTQPEFITQKRILDKKPQVVQELNNMYEEYKAAFPLQLKLPATYNAYETKETFVAYYPFVPYQFRLIMQVFNAFLQLGYVAKEVKGNERSIIKVTHSTAKKNAEEQVGRFVSFDEFYNSMFEEGLQYRGQKAIDNAVNMARTYTQNPELAVRVANVLFMICNISKSDQLLFPATVDNVTSLLINDMRTSRLTLKNDVERIIDFLCDNNIIRREQGKNGAVDTFSFYSEEEMNVAKIIKGQKVDNNTQAEQLREVFFKYLNTLKNKEQYLTRAFAVGATIMQRQYLSNNPEIMVEFVMDNDYDTPEQLALTNPKNRLVYYVGPQYRSNKKLFNTFYWFCQVNRYLNTPSAPEETEIRKSFEKRAQEQFEEIILPEFKMILDSCPIISGPLVVDELELGGKRGGERFHLAIQKHLASIYTKAVLVDSPSVPRNSEALKKAILRPINPGDYEGMNGDPTPAEHEVEIYLSRQYGEVNVSEITSKFAKWPYGWDSVCTLYVVNELVRRNRREYSYANNPNVNDTLVASRLLTETKQFTLREAKPISEELIKQFIAAWKDVFGISESFTTTDSKKLFQLSHDRDATRTNDVSIGKKREGYRHVESMISAYPFVEPIHRGIDLFDKWMEIRDPETFFKSFNEHHQETREIIDLCKEVATFTNDHLPVYKDLRKFAADNKYNLTFVPEEFKSKAEEFQGIETDKRPFDKFRTYIKLQRELESVLRSVREDLRQRIRTAYNDTFTQLEAVAKEQDVPLSILDDKDKVIMVKTTPDNFLLLINNANTDAFYQNQIAKILDYVNKRKKEEEQPQTPEPGKSGQEPKGPEEKKVLQTSLQTRTNSPLTNEQEIDRYLEGLKGQLMKLVKENGSVMIVK